MSKKNVTKKEVTLDDLAAMVQNGFAELRTEFKADLNGLEIGLRAEMKKLDKKIEEVKEDTKAIRGELNKKVDKFEHKCLEYRVEKLEKKFA